MTAHTNKGFKHLLVAAIVAGTPKKARKMKPVIKKQVFVFAQVWPRAVESTRSWNRRTLGQQFSGDRKVVPWN
jgi:hypothetical protein